MPAPSTIAAPPAYQRHQPEQTALFSIVAEHYPRFVQEIERSGGHRPGLVRQEFEDYLQCGLVDHVFPKAPVRQWVLTFPFPLRFLLAAHPEALSQVLAVVQRGISTFVIHRSGLTVASGAKTGAVTLIQRFGSALNLNIHLHMLFLDGAYTFSGQRASFHRARRPSNAELAQLLDTLSRRIVRLLERRGVLIADPECPAHARSVEHLVAGPGGSVGSAPADRPIHHKGVDLVDHSSNVCRRYFGHRQRQ